MHVDFFSGTFYAMRSKYKKKYFLSKDDVSEYFFESLFILSVQALLCVLVLIKGAWRKTIESPGLNSFQVNLAMFFTNLVLHFSCIATIRNGINMVKFVIYHKNEFDNPVGAFSLGILLVLVNILCACTNMLQAMK